MTTLSVSAVSSPCNLATASAVVFSFSQRSDAVLYLVSGLLDTDGHFDIVQTHYKNLHKWLLVLGTLLWLHLINLLGLGEKFSQTENRKSRFILTRCLLACFLDGISN